MPHKDPCRVPLRVCEQDEKYVFTILSHSGVVLAYSCRNRKCNFQPRRLPYISVNSRLALLSTLIEKQKWMVLDDDGKQKQVWGLLSLMCTWPS
eukprot:1153045-Pelagomonas_calceolata.AAC.5